jgi:ApbE superfamily uncharacterized protein (UPF0280 family)
MYQPRTYRHWVKDKSLIAFTVTVKETDLYIRARRHLEAEALASVLKHRTPLEEYIAAHPDFLHTLEPIAVEETAPDIVRQMAIAAEKVGVGPMAAVAGAVAEAVGRDLLNFTSEVIVENGGDIFLKIARTRLVGIYAGSSPLTGRLALKIFPGDTPLGVCTSSGTVGHSLSFGTADAAIALAPSAALADAAATAIGNRVKTIEDIPPALEWAKTVPGLIGAVIIKGDRLGVWGKVNLVPTKSAAKN